MEQPNVVPVEVSSGSKVFTHSLQQIRRLDALQKLETSTQATPKATDTSNATSARKQGCLSGRFPTSGASDTGQSLDSLT